MLNSGMFTSAFDGLDLETLSWIQVSRACAEEFLGHKRGEAPEGEIPGDIGDSFGYRLKTLTIVAGFSGYFYPTEPLSIQYCLGFYFGQSDKPGNPLGTTEGFEFLANKKLVFWSGRFGAPKEQVGMESQNLGMHCQPYRIGDRNSFTDVGKQIMEDFFRNIPKIVSIQGLRESEQDSLAFLLRRVQEDYLAGTLEPRDIFYT